MVKLLLQEAGTVRTFQLGDGVLSVGSGEQASLRVASPDVAVLHYELEVQGEAAIVRPQGGVLPPLINGKPQASATRIGLREPVQVGAAILWLDADESSSSLAPLAASSPVVRASGRANAKLATGSKKRFPAQPKGPRMDTKANYGGNQSKVESTRRSVKRGLPSGLLIGAPLLLLLVAFFVVRKRIDAVNEQGIFSVSEMLDIVEQKLDRFDLSDAEHELGRILPRHERSPLESLRLQAVRQRLDSMRAEEIELQGNLLGTKFMDVQLKRYEQSNLQGSPSDAQIRLFLLRTKEFRERWPRHPEMAWVERMESRFEGSVDLNDPPSYEDVAWETKYIDIGENRNFKRAFALIAEARGSIAALDIGKLDRLEGSLRQSRDEHFQERMDKVEDVLEFFSGAAKPVGWLLHLVLWCDDPELADRAAHKLIAIEGADACLRGYKDPYPELYKGILAHPVIQEFARAKQIVN